MRFVVECVWSGYRSSQSRTCHRTVIPKYMAEKLKKIHGIRFTDGTYMSVEVRPALHRERVSEIHGYDSLLSKMAHADKVGSVSVMDVNL